MKPKQDHCWERFLKELCETGSQAQQDRDIYESGQLTCLEQASVPGAVEREVAVRANRIQDKADELASEEGRVPVKEEEASENRNHCAWGPMIKWELWFNQVTKGRTVQC